MISTLKPVLFLICLSLLSCKKDQFTELDAAKTGINFENTIHEDENLNILTFEYMYNGGGVGIGDFNNDNLQDVYFTANTGSNKLFLNQGDLKFKDITTASKTGGEGRWSSGVAVVDINQDGLQDIYIAATAKKNAAERANVLYINQGLNKDNVPSFKNMAEEYGLADTTHSTNVTFLDYDNDSDLDVFVLVNEMDDVVFPNKYHDKIVDGSSKRTDRLYRNDFDPKLGHPVFTNVSKQAGIRIEGYGLGVNVTDINQDGWKDIYVTNDYLTNDIIYINNQDGTFTDQADHYTRHTSHSAMGNDVADINNDGRPDLFSVDMMPQTNERKKMMVPANSYISFLNNDVYGYQYQYSRNTLQLNMGKDPKNNQPHFSEIGLFSGVAQTDWSWTPLIADFDRDQNKDIIITNGFPRDITDQDFVAYRNESISLMTKWEIRDFMPSIKIKNFAFKNNGDLRFTDVSKSWGIKNPSFSNGAAYADFDNDGDLDYVVNNINMPAQFYKNNEEALDQSTFLTLKLQGEGANANGIGSVVEITSKDKNGIFTTQTQELSPYRGYLSSHEAKLFFGFNEGSHIEHLKIKWYNGLIQEISKPSPNQVLHLKIKDARQNTSQNTSDHQTLLWDVSDSVNISYQHVDKDFIDFNFQKLLPHKLSQFGPSLAAGDLNADGLDDLVVGGSHDQSLTFLLQNTKGGFDSTYLGVDTKGRECMGILLLDADKDKDLDLLISYGSYEYKAADPILQPELYINQNGRFSLSKSALPNLSIAASCVKGADIDNDGDIDLFIGGRQSPKQYPKPVSSYLLINESTKNGVKFNNASDRLLPDLKNIGMVCDALFSDFNQDGLKDLIVVGEWMAPMFFENKSKSFEHRKNSLSNLFGWWNSTTASDLDQDGDIDYVFGNAGQNSLYTSSEKYPSKIYHGDFNEDGNYDAIPTTYYINNKGVKNEVTFNSRDDLHKQFIQIRKRFNDYAGFANATIDQVLTKEEIKKGGVLSVTSQKSIIAKNNGKGDFEIIELPTLAQTMPVFGVKVDDFNDDGNKDLLLIGNDYGTDVSIGRQDASYGSLFLGDGKLNFKNILAEKSGIFIKSDAKSIVSLKYMGNKKLIVIGSNNGTLKCYKMKTNKDIASSSESFLSQSSF